MMDIDKLVEVLHRINRKREKQVDEEVLKQIIALVIKNPLNEDRDRCQEQINFIIAQRTGEKKDDS